MQIHSRRYVRSKGVFYLKHNDNMNQCLRSQGDCHVLLPLHAQRFPRTVAYHRHNTNIQHSIHGKSKQFILLKRDSNEALIVFCSHPCRCSECSFLVSLVEWLCWLSICRGWHAHLSLGKAVLMIYHATSTNMFIFNSRFD